MVFGPGHDMMNKMKQNRSQKPSNRSKFKEKNPDVIYSTDKESKQLQFKNVSEEELIELKKQIREEAKTERKKEWLLLGTLLICGLVSIIVIWYLLS
jgi:hypothetical protein